MGVFVSKRAVDPIGCVIKRDAVRMLQIARDGRDIVAASVNIEPAGERTRSTRADAVRRARASADFEGRRVVSSIPLDSVCCRRMLLAPMPEQDMVSAIYWQIARELGHEPSDLCTDYYEVGEALDGSKPRREVITVSATTDTIRGHVMPLIDAGLSPAAVDTLPGALARSLSANRSKPTLIVDLDAESSTIMVAQDGAPRFMHAVSLPIVASPTSDDPDRTGPVFDIEAFAVELGHEVRMCMHYLSEHGSGSLLPNRGCVVGAGQIQERLAENLAKECDIEFLPPADAAPSAVKPLLNRFPNGEHEHWLAPLGLAMYGRENTVAEPAL